jgi:preprotein translocase subunit SecD
MRRGTLLFLLLIVLLGLGAAFVIFWPNTSWHGVTNPFTVEEGLDLQGGVSFLLVPEASQHYTAQEVDNSINNVASHIEGRISGSLGAKSPDVRVLSDNSGNKMIEVDLPGFTSGNQAQAIKTLLSPGVLEFWDTGSTPYATGQALVPSQIASTNGGTTAIFNGNDLDPSQISVGTDSQTGQIVINFEMKGDAIGRFATFTKDHVGDYLTVTLDKSTISSAVIDSEINGPGIIQGTFTQDQAQSIATVMQYGALPLALTVASQQSIGATLGADSITKSEIAAAIGLAIVMIFMLVYYRLPGLLADCALALYAMFTFSIFKVAGVTLTLPGIAGFILSVGMAVDANVLIFERVKEELRAGRLMASAIDMGWRRAWPSIRDSNISTMITCAVLFYFGSNFGASTIVGFATTLFLGVIISMFTAILVTRTFLNVLVPFGITNHPALFGLPASAIAPASASLTRHKTAV